MQRSTARLFSAAAKGIAAKEEEDYVDYDYNSAAETRLPSFSSHPFPPLSPALELGSGIERINKPSSRLEPRTDGNNDFIAVIIIIILLKDNNK